MTSGKSLPIDGVTVQLQDRARTKTYYETTTKFQSDTTDTYTFWPVPVKKKFLVVATFNGQEQTYKIRRMKYGEFKPDIDFTFED